MLSLLVLISKFQNVDFWIRIFMDFFRGFFFDEWDLNTELGN